MVCEDASEGFSEDDVELLGIIQGKRQSDLDHEVREWVPYYEAIYTFKWCDRNSIYNAEAKIRWSIKKDAETSLRERSACLNESVEVKFLILSDIQVVLSKVFRPVFRFEIGSFYWRCEIKFQTRKANSAAGKAVSHDSGSGPISAREFSAHVRCSIWSKKATVRCQNGQLCEETVA